MKYKLVIFDLDGTLLDSIDGIGAAMNEVLKAHNFPRHDREAYYYFVGNGMKKLAERALPAEAVKAEGVEKYYLELIQAYDIHYGVGLRLYDGIAEMLDTLQKKGIKLAINSNKVHHMVEKIAKDSFGKWDWVATLGAREGIAIKPSPEAVYEIIEKCGVSKEEVLYVGDSEVDVETAKNAGVDAAYVSWGFRRPEDINLSEVRYIIHKPQELEEYIVTEC